MPFSASEVEGSHVREIARSIYNNIMEDPAKYWSFLEGIERERISPTGKKSTTSIMGAEEIPYVNSQSRSDFALFAVYDTDLGSNSIPKVAGELGIIIPKEINNTVGYGMISEVLGKMLNTYIEEKRGGITSEILGFVFEDIKNKEREKDLMEALEEVPDRLYSFVGAKNNNSTRTNILNLKNHTLGEYLLSRLYDVPSAVTGAEEAHDGFMTNVVDRFEIDIPAGFNKRAILNEVSIGIGEMVKKYADRV